MNLIMRIYTENFTPLKELADKYNISLMLVMHNRKTEDPTDPIF